MAPPRGVGGVAHGTGRERRVSPPRVVRRVEGEPIRARATAGAWPAMIALGLVLALQPVAADGVWWDAARGRAVMGGAIAPAAALSAGDEHAEADWLGGVPWFLLFEIGGPTGLMVARLLGVGCVVGCCLVLTVGRPGDALAIGAGAAALVAAAPGLDPTGTWWDVIAGWTLVAWNASTASNDSRRQAEAAGSRGRPFVDRRALGVVAIAMAWANLGPRSLLALAGCATGRPVDWRSGVESIVTWPTVRRTKVVAGRWSAPSALAAFFHRVIAAARSDRGISLLVLAALCATPRGPLGLVDSAWILLPPVAVAMQEGARPAWLAGHAIAGPPPAPIQFLAWFVLALVAMKTWRSCDMGSGRIAAWAGLQGLLVANPASLPALTPWAWWLAVGMVGRADPGQGRLFPGTSRDVSSRARWAPAATVAVWLMAMLAASGPWPGLPWRLGWGVAPRLEYRQLVEPLAAGGRAGDRDGTAFAFDTRAAGMLVWAHPAGPRPWLVPHRALLAGRFVDEAMRAAELRAGWDMRQRDGDGAWGGWWVPLMTRDTRLLVVPAGDVATLRRLEPGIFKPLVIDAPVVPFAMAGDVRLSQAILRALADRALVENGTWTFAVPRSIQTDWSLDLWGACSGRPDHRPLLAQADVFLAMRLPRAALKMLLPLAQARLVDCTDRIADATMQLAERERLTLGQPTAFRAAVLRVLAVRPGPDTALARSLADMPGATALADDARDGHDHDMMLVASTYLATGAPAAIDRLVAEGIDEPWTLAALALEAGRPAAARTALERLATGADPRLAAAALDLLDELAGPEETR